MFDKAMALITVCPDSETVIQKVYFESGKVHMAGWNLIS